MAEEKSNGEWKRKLVNSFASRIGLPGTFLNLEIKGLAEVVRSNEISKGNKELILRFLNHISPEVTERRQTFYTHKLRKLTEWLSKDFREVEE